MFWVASDFNSVQVAPEGRYLGYIESPLISSSLGGKTFTVHVPRSGATFTGRLVSSNSTYNLYDGAVTMDSSTTYLSSPITLTAL